MPEAAEVAVAVAQLAHVAVGRRIEALTVSHPRTVRHLDRPDALDQFRGPVAAVARHGKWLLVEAGDSGSRLGIHLRMSGRLIAAPAGSLPPRHVHAVFRLSARPGPAAELIDAPKPPADAVGIDDEPVDVWFFDPRTFGELRSIDPARVPVAEDLFDPAVDAGLMAERALRRRVGVKAVLLDQQRFVAGIGSYLADETLHRAGLSPLRPADSLAESAWARVLDAARSITVRSTAAGGVTLADEGWLDLWERPGRHGHELVVHGLDRCGACGTETRRAVVGGRSARWCPRCQPLRRRR